MLGYCFKGETWKSRWWPCEGQASGQRHPTILFNRHCSSHVTSGSITADGLQWLVRVSLPIPPLSCSRPSPKTFFFKYSSPKNASLHGGLGIARASAEILWHNRPQSDVVGCVWHSASTQPRLLDHYYHIHILHVLSSVKNGLLLPVDRCVTCSLLLTPQMAVVARSLLAECSSVVWEPEGQGFLTYEE